MLKIVFLCIKISEKILKYKINNVCCKKSHDLKNDDVENKIFKLCEYKHPQRVNTMSFLLKKNHLVHIICYGFIIIILFLVAQYSNIIIVMIIKAYNPIYMAAVASSFPLQLTIML